MTTTQETTLTEEELCEDPLALLNAEPEDRQAFFEALRRPEKR